MLQKLSDGAKGGISKFILVGFLFMAVAGLVLTDVGGFFRDGVSSTNVAEVGSEDIPYHEFDRFLRNTLSRQNISPQDAFMSGQVNQLLERYAQDILFEQASESLGVRAPEKAVAQELHRFVRPYLSEGTTPQRALNEFLNQQGLSEENLVTVIRRDLTSNVLKQAILSGVETAPELLSKELLRYENEYRDVSYITFPHATVEIENTPTDEELEDIYNISKAQYRIPERRAFTIAILDTKALTDDVSVSEEDLRTYYDNNKVRYEIPGGQKIEQAIFPTENVANEFVGSLENPDNFREKAGSNYRSSNVYQEENAPEALKDILFAEDVSSSVRGPVQSPLGWHVIHDMGEAEASTRPFEDVKGTIKILLERDLKREVVMDAMENINDRIDDEEPLETLVNDYSMETLDIAPVDQFGTDKDGESGLASFEKDQTVILESLFDTYEDELSELIELHDGRVAIIKINQVVPESVKSFEDVKDQIAQRVINDRKRLKNQETVQAHLQQLKAGETDLSKIAGTSGFKIQTKKNVKRGFAEEDLKTIPLDLKARIFLSEPNEYFTSTVPDAFVIAQTSNRRLEDAELTEETKGLAQRLAIVETLTTYYNYLSEKTPVKVNQRLLQQLYGQPQG